MLQLLFRTLAGQCRQSKGVLLELNHNYPCWSVSLFLLNQLDFSLAPSLIHGHRICRCLGSSVFRNPTRIESYFSAIGGESDDPPPDLTPEQVTAILRTNESLILNTKLAEESAKFLENFVDVLESRKLAKNKKFAELRKRKLAEQPKSTKPLYSIIDHPWVTQIESNQLAANHPIEDRLRVCSIDFAIENTKHNNSDNNSNDDNQKAVFCGVFDGHGGGFCADIIARRLFHYIAVGLKVLQLRTLQPNAQTEASFISNIGEWLANNSIDHVKSPSRFYHNVFTMYEEEIAQRLQSRIEQFEFTALKEFALKELNRDDGYDDNSAKHVDYIKHLLERASIRCDEDLSREIEANLVDTQSNVLLHYYHSLAVSGCCSVITLVYESKVYVASTGDCRAVMGLLKNHKLPSSFSSPSSSLPSRDSIHKQLRMIELSCEHNVENANELNRIYSEHPKEEHNFIIRENRLLGQLMPFRAFGDFPFKWTVDKMKHLGLTKAFGSHVIPTFYRTPPYLTAMPEITNVDLEQDVPNIWSDRFLVLGTDGLWDQFESPRKVVKAVNRYRQNWFKQVMAYTSAQVYKIESKDDRPLTLQEIVDRLSEQVKEPPVTTFKRITADDDLIEDINCGTYLLRTALSDISVQVPRTMAAGRKELGARTDLEEEKFSHHVDQYEQQRRRHSKLVAYLTLPQTVVRNFRDDISLIVIGLK